MKRALVGLGILALLAAPARAQVAFYFQPLSDTAAAGVPGKPATVEIRARDSLGTTVKGANLTFYYDTTKVQILGVQVLATGLDTIVDTVRGPGAFTVAATGAVVGYDDAVYRLQVQLKPGASSGTYLWVKSDSVPSLNGTLVALGSIGQVCHATTGWGDVSGDGQVDSRDALITLSAAVGLPVTGFDLAIGDVDGDGLVNSRDALMMLSWAIGIPVSGRIGNAVLDACPGPTAPGDSVVFYRNDAPAGLYTLSGATPVAIPGATATAPDPNARLSPDGKTVVYVCPGNAGWQICRINTDGSGFAQLTSDSMQTNTDPDWSPAGDSIVFLRYGSSITVMDATGGNIHGVDLTQARDVKYSRDGTHFAYVNAYDGGLYVATTNGSGPTLVATGDTDITAIRWSPGGDSLAFTRSTDPRLWVVPVGGGTPGLIFSFAGKINGGDWSSAGILISLDTGTGSSLWFSKSIGAPIYRVTQPKTFDLSPAWRRSP